MSDTSVNNQGRPSFEDFRGTYVGRDQYNIHLVYPPGPFQLKETDLESLRSCYLGYILGSVTRLDFKGLRVIEAIEKASGLSLEEVYVPLHARPELPQGETWQRIGGRIWKGEEALAPEEAARLEQRTEPVSIETTINQHTTLIILGDPGAGKSTLLRMLAVSLARQENAPLPILVPLSTYADALGRETINLRDYLPRYFASRQGILRGLAPLFEIALQQGQAVVLLDGLDEVQARREYLVGLVEDFVREVVPSSEEKPGKSRRKDSHAPPGNRVIVTSRFVGYRQAPLLDARWRTYALVDWEKPEIEQFVERWTRAVEVAMAGGQATPKALESAVYEKRDLLGAIFSSPGIERLAGNPLLLTLLALIKRQGVTLPHRRVELYELYLQTLLRDWRTARTLDKDPVGPEIDYLQTVQILASLGLWLRQHNPQAGLIPEEKLQDYLIGYFQEEESLSKTESRKATDDFLDAVHRYSNLLLERGRGQYGFIHLTFEEYLAGKGLARLKQPAALEQILIHLEDPAWHETILLAIGALGIVKQSPEQAGELLEALLEAKLPGEKRGENVVLAGEALRDVEKVGVGTHAARSITQALVKTMQDADIKPTRRRQTGRILGDTGWTPKDLEDFVEIPPGKFLYSEGKETVEIPYRFWIARYPVTNLQFGRLVEDGGYRQQAWWSRAGWDWREAEQRTQPAFWTDREENNPIFPVIGVSWYEGEAYCRWLNSQKLPVPLPPGYQARLPSEMEWERAARGVDGREYPWGEAFDARFANTWEVKTRGTTAVCTYPQGANPAGVWDMAGNVWEWTASWWDEAKKARVVRGGSWRDLQWLVRCACRDGRVPTLFGDSLGFRVVLSLAFSES